MTWNKNVVSKLQRNPPDLVLISMSRWIFTANTGEENVNTEANALVRQIRKIPTKSKVVIIQDPPLPTNIDVPVCLSSYLYDYRKCGFSRSLGYGSAMGSREQAAAKATGAGVIDLTAAICPGTASDDCPAVLNNMIVWRDKHHLTATFSATLGPAIDEQLVAQLVAWANPTISPPTISP
jgi:hypothetical protein